MAHQRADERGAAASGLVPHVRGGLPDRAPAQGGHGADRRRHLSREQALATRHLQGRAGAPALQLSCAPSSQPLVRPITRERAPRQAAQILQKYCLGDDPISFEVRLLVRLCARAHVEREFPDRVRSCRQLSGHVRARARRRTATCGPTLARRKEANFHNPHHNIGLPVFSIHGNHDDPAGAGHMSVIDLLSVTALVNYFGKAPQVDEITISPVLITKGVRRRRAAHRRLSPAAPAQEPRGWRSTGWARSATSACTACLRTTRCDCDGSFVRLPRDGVGAHTLPRSRQVKWEMPKDGGDWFNLFVIHQNRHKHGPGAAKNVINEKVLPKFLHLVFWGHEHECRVKEEVARARAVRPLSVSAGKL